MSVDISISVRARAGARGQGGGAVLCSAFAASLSCCKAKSSY